MSMVDLLRTSSCNNQHRDSDTLHECLRHTTRARTILTINTKTKMSLACVRSTLLYGIQTQCLPHAAAKKDSAKARPRIKATVTLSQHTFTYDHVSVRSSHGWCRWGHSPERAIRIGLYVRWSRPLFHASLAFHQTPSCIMLQF